jgi:hypothetical protein
MELRYLGFQQRQSARAYQFEVVKKGETSKRFTVTVEMGLFLKHRVGIQEGPALSANKLVADLEKSLEGEHELTSDDLHAHASARALAEATRAATRKTTPRRPAATTEGAERSPWR